MVASLPSNDYATSAMMEYPRPESRRTVLFGDDGSLDEKFIMTAHGRPIPSPEFSLHELNHLKKIARSSDEMLDVIQTPTTKQLGRIAFNAVNGCWELPISLDKQGTRARYPHLSIAAVSDSALAHRTMFRVFYGIEALPNGPEGSKIFLDHLCENKSCCYPRHLEAVTIKVNNHRALGKHSRNQPRFF